MKNDYINLRLDQITIDLLNAANLLEMIEEGSVDYGDRTHEIKAKLRDILSDKMEQLWTMPPRQPRQEYR